jgi:hypothetical protein
MRRLNRLSIVLVIVILVISIASAWLILSLTPAPSNLSASSSVSDGFQLTITLEANKTQYTKGENIPLAFTITNVSNQTQNFTNTNGDTNFNFQVYNSANKQVYSWIHGAYALVNDTIPLAPNESFSQTLNWPQKNDLSGGFPQVTSGACYIIGEVGENTPYKLQTPPLNITIC